MFDTLIIHPLTNLLVGIYQVLAGLGIPSALGFAIIIFTLVIRLILSPLTASQLRTAKKMQGLHPHLSRLKAQHKNDAQRLQQETMKLYQEHGVNPVAGCLPMLLQLPLLFGLFELFKKMVEHTSYAEINKVLYFDAIKLDHMWDTNFFGLPLTKNPSELFSTMGAVILLIPISAILLQLVQSKMMAVKPSDEPKKKTDEPDMASMMQTNMLYVLPLIIGISSWSFPVGLSLYWNTFSVFGMIQQYKIQGWGGASEWIEKITGKPQQSIVEKKNVVVKKKQGKKKHGR